MIGKFAGVLCRENKEHDVSSLTSDFDLCLLQAENDYSILEVLLVDKIKKAMKGGMSNEDIGFVLWNHAALNNFWGMTAEYHIGRIGYEVLPTITGVDDREQSVSLNIRNAALVIAGLVAAAVLIKINHDSSAARATNNEDHGAFVSAEISGTDDKGTK